MTGHDFAAMVLRNSYFRFDVPGSSTPADVHFWHLRFTAQANANVHCLGSCASAAANAINIATMQAQQYVNNLPPSISPDEIIRLTKLELFSKIANAFKNQMQDCNSSYTTDVAIAGAITSYLDFPVVNCDEQIVNCPD